MTDWNECGNCDCASGAVKAAGGCPRRLTDEQLSQELDRAEEQHRNPLEGGEWAFFWAAVTIAMVGLLALAGKAWRAWPW